MVDPVLYCLLFIVIFIINVVPAFMPPTWIILAFLFLQYHLAFLPTILLGVFAATSGRVVLALLARSWLRPYLSATYVKNYAHLGKYFKKHQKFTIPFVLGYALSPLSSNSLFIIAGLSGMNLDIIAFSFFLGRLFTYTFWVSLTSAVTERFASIFLHSFSNSNAFLSSLFSLVIIIVIGKINWMKLLKLQ